MMSRPLDLRSASEGVVGHANPIGAEDRIQTPGFFRVSHALDSIG
jgi:hypothetical protein